MSNEVNVTELLYGVIDAGVEFEYYFWGDGNSFNNKRNKARFFSVSPDPAYPAGPGVTFTWYPSVLNFEITRVWNTVWANSETNNVFQTNVAIKNLGPGNEAFHLIQAETDN